MHDEIEREIYTYKFLSYLIQNSFSRRVYSLRNNKNHLRKKAVKDKSYFDNIKVDKCKTSDRDTCFFWQGGVYNTITYNATNDITYY